MVSPKTFRPAPCCGWSSRRPSSCRSWHWSHSPQMIVNGTTMRSPTFSLPLASGPTSTTSPIGSWPITSPRTMSGMKPSKRCRSEPQMLVVTLTMASRGSSISGSGTLSQRMSFLPCQTSARMMFPRRFEFGSSRVPRPSSGDPADQVPHGTTLPLPHPPHIGPGRAGAVGTDHEGFPVGGPCGTGSALVDKNRTASDPLWPMAIGVEASRHRVTAPAVRVAARSATREFPRPPGRRRARRASSTAAASWAR